MDVNTGHVDAAGRLRVVMIVDNRVHGDSRVQKSARSAATAGWDVILLGRTDADSEETWQIGDATVRLLPLKSRLSKRRHEFRRRWIAAPLAYPPTGIADRRRDEVKAWRADLTFRRALAATGQAGGGKLSRIAWRVESLSAKAVGRWVRFRSRQLATGRKARRRLATPTDRAYTRFWRTVMGDRAWRRLEPGLWDYELTYGPIIDRLNPDLIHANDFRMIGVGARAKVRAAAKGRDIKLVWDAHEFLPGVQPWQDNLRWLAGNIAHEREYAKHANAVITVSASLAELLQETHHLAERPAVVLNAPDLDHAVTEVNAAPELRRACRIDVDVPLIVYSGLAAEKRGIGIMVEAMPQLPDAHVALIVGNVDSSYVKGLRKRAETLGASNRLHVLPYVPHWQVTQFLSSADVGVIPIKHFPNHELALITKFFEYSHARLPIVVSDVRTMAETVRSTGQGEVFRVDDVDDYIKAVNAVLSDRARYQAAYDAPGLLDGWTWAAQAKTLDALYQHVLGIAGEQPAGPAANASARPLKTPVPVAS